MSQETLTWLNTQVVIGNTDQRGTAWHYRASEQGVEPNHYPGFVPVEDVRRRLFGWKVTEGDVTSTGMNEDGVFTIRDPDRKAMLRPPGALGPEDPGAIMGVFMSGYRGHDYEEWLLNVVAQILDDELGVSSAGLLKQAAIAWVEVSVPNSVTTPAGVTFRANLLATTSFDGSIATTFKRTIQDTVCDNTRAAALRETGPTFKVKHSRNSNLKLIEAREALEVVHTMADDFAAEVEQLCNTTVTDSQWDKFLNELLPVPEDKGAARTIAQGKHTTLNRLWDHDVRVQPWRNTAHGAIQAVNTARQHEFTVRGMTRPERNMLNAITGETERADRAAFAVLEKVLA